jgi:hypothetical protein
MTIMPMLSTNSSFSMKHPNLQLAWDSTSIGRLKTCPRYYYFTMIRGFNSLTDNPHLIFGQIYHKALEIYDHRRFEGADHETALHAAVQHGLVASWDSVRKRPWTSNDPNKNRHTLLRSIVWYLDKFQSDPMATIQLANGKPAVELSFRFEAEGIKNYLTDEPFILCGHLDRLAKMGEQVFISDRKTTKSTIDENFFANFTPDNQMSLYALAGKIVYKTSISAIVIDAAQVAVTFSRFGRGLVQRTPSQLDDWYKDLSHWLGMAQMFADQNYWPANDKACFRCAFRPICSHAPEVREEWLKSSYPVSIWDPLVIRGDV